MSVKDRIRRIVFSEKIERNKTYAEHIGVCVVNSKEQQLKESIQKSPYSKED